MKYKEDYIKLSDRIGWKSKELVEDILRKNIDLDLTYNEGELFTLAVENNCVEITKKLLSYVNDNQLAKYNSGSTEYLLLKNKLRDILETAIEDIEVSQEMKEVLSLYINFEGSENNDDLLENEVYTDNNLILKDQVNFTTFKKSYSMNDLHNSTFDNSKENLLTEENLKKLSNNSSDEKLKFTEGFLGHQVTYDTKEHHSDLAGNLYHTDEF